MRKAVTAVIILAFVIASAAVYGLFNLNSAINAKPDTSQLSNYSAYVGSLKPQISSINNSISSLGGLKSDISDIRGKLSDLESKISQQSTQTAKPVAILDRTTYIQGDTVYIIAAGLEPQSTVQVQLLDSNGNVLNQAQTRSDSSGKITYDFPVSSTQTSGRYQIKIISGQFSVSQPITVTRTQPIQTPPTIYPLTAGVDKSIYLRGDLVRISGMGAPVTTVNAVFTSPSGKSYVASTTTSSNGAYQLSFVIGPSFETGYWNVNVTNEGQTKGLYSFYVASDTTNSGSFSVQTNKMFYNRGEQIQITGTGTPFTTVNSVLTSPSGKTFVMSTNVGSDGSYQLSYSTTSFEIGYWNLDVTNGGEGKEFSIYVGASGSSSSSSFTAQTDKTIYPKGSQINIQGVAQPYSSVDAIMKSPSGVTYGVSTNTGIDGSYSLSFPTSSSYETGNWSITISNLSMAKVISVFLEP